MFWQLEQDAIYCILFYELVSIFKKSNLFEVLPDLYFDAYVFLLKEGRIILTHLHPGAF